MQSISNITAQTNAIIFIDAAVEDYQTLAANIEPGTEVIILDAARDGVAQITEVLRERRTIGSVQIVSHGSDGLLQLGTTELSNENLAVYEKQLQQWGEALSAEGDILLYGCNVAATDAGKTFVERLSQTTQAEIAASDDLSGNADLGGDWVLEYATGLVEAPLAFQVGVMDAYDAVLATIKVTTAEDNEFNEDGKINVINDDKKISLREAIVLAENGGTTTFINEEGIEETITVPSNEPDIIDLSEISGQTIILNSSLPTLTEDTEFKGAGVTINGRGEFNKHQIISVNAQDKDNTVIFSNLAFYNGLARGGYAYFGAGGGLGAGGAIFINSGSVVVDGVVFKYNRAEGGKANYIHNASTIIRAGYGGKEFGEGDRRSIGTVGGKGGDFNISGVFDGTGGGSAGRVKLENTTPGSKPGEKGVSGGDGKFGGGGGSGGGGAGGDKQVFFGDGGKPGGNGGKGGFGGGGGAGGGGGGDDKKEGTGGGGAGGEGGSFGGKGTAGSPGSTNGAGGEGGFGGGGAGLGGAIFVKEGASLTLINSSFSNNSVIGGTGGDNNNGQGEGNNIFVMKNATVEAYGGSNITGVYNDNNNNKEANITPSNLPSVSISSTNNATEKNSVELAKTGASFELKLNKTFPVDLTLNFTVGGTATQGTDYQLFIQDENGNYELKDRKYVEKQRGGYKKIDNNSIIIPAGQTSATINVASIDDKIYEGNETINIKLLDKAQNQAELTITDDEPQIALEKVQDAKEGGQLGEFKLKLENNHPAPRSMNAIIQLNNGTAELGTDYRFKYFDVNEKLDKYITQVNNNNQFTIPISKGAEEVVFQVDATGELINNKGIYDDNRDEGEEGEGEAGELVSIILVPTLENQKQKDYGVKNNAGNAQLNILDGENIEDNSRVKIDKSIINVTEGGDGVTYSLQLISKPTANVTVEFVTDTDLQTIQNITFTPENWNDAQTVTVKAIEDTDSEGTETKAITHKLSSADTFYNQITIPNVNVQIKDRTFDAEATTDGLTAALGKIQSLIDDQLLAIELPIVGSLKTIAPDFIGNLKNSLITEIGGNNLNQAGLKTTIETAIKNAFGIDDFEVNTNITFDKGTFQEATFDITLGNTYNLLDVSLSSDLGLPALGINVDGDAEMTFDYSLGLGFGFHTDFGFFIDSQKTGFNAGISLGLSDDFKAQGSMGFLQLDLNNDADNLTEAKIDFNADLNDLDNLEAEDGKPAEDDGERLTYKELIGDYKLKELFDVGLSGGANIGLSALTSFNGDAAFPAFGFDFAAGFDAEYSILSNEEEESTEEESEEKSRLTFNQPTLAFNNVDLDIGSFVSDFAKPVVSKINEVIDPFRPIIDLLNTDTKLLNKLGIQSIFDENGDNKVTVLEMALAVAKISGKGGNAKYIEFFDAITKLSDLTEKINKFSDTDDSIIIELGSYEIDTSFDATDENADSTSATAKATEKKSLDEQLEILEDEVDNIKRTQVDIVKGFTGDADFLVPILTNPALVLGLLFGKDVSLFTYDLPVLQVGFEAEAVFDIYPPISGLLEGGVDVTLDLAFGYDTFGFNQWKALNFALEEVYRVFDGFYVSDTKIVDGKEIDINELVVKATIAVGLGLDFKVISAYLKGGIEGIIGLDLVDGGEVNGTDDGKLRVSEIIPRLKTPWELFQLSGVVNVFLGGEVKVIGATVWDERLATFKLAEFSVGPKGNSAGSVFDGDIVAGKVFFDANFNNIQDEFEPYTYSNVDGSYDLDIPLYLFDVNANGVIDDEEGQIVVVDGIDSSIFIEQKAPIITTNDATVASPLTTLAVTIAEPDLAAAQTLVAGVFNLPDNVDLLNYNPQKVDLSVFAIQSQLQNLIIPVTKEISKTIPVSEQIPASEIANLLFTALGNRISSDINPDLSDQDILTSIIEEVINQVEQKYSLNIDTIDIDQLAEIITGDNFSINDILADDSLDAATKRKEIAKITELPEIAGGFQQLVINPLATLTKTVVTAGNTATSQIQVKQALDIADVDLFNYDPLEAINEGDSNGLTVFAKQAQVQNTIVQLTKLVKGSSQESIEKAASDVIETIADKIASDTEVNLSDKNQVETLIKETAPELENVAAGAADIITTGNKRIDAIVAEGTSSDTDKALEIAKIQQVAQGEAANDLEEVGKGVKTIQDAVNENTGDGLVTQINATDVNNPTNRNLITNEPTSLVLDSGTQTWEITGNESIVPLKFALTGTDTEFVNEVGLFFVDDAENRIDGLLPGDAGYQEAALKRAKVIFSALPGNNPGITRQLPFSGGMRLGFYLVANGTTDGVIQGGSNPGDVYFSIPQANAEGIKPLQVSEANGKFTLAWEDTPELANSDFNDLLMTFEIQQQNLTLQQAIANFQGDTQAELFDLRLLAGREVQTEFPIVNSEASYNNVFGLYRVENKQGTVIDSISGESLNPGDTGYTAAAIRLSQSAQKGVSLNRNNQGLATTLEGGFLYAPFLIANGKPEAVLDDDTLNDPSVYFSFIQANSDGVDHVRLLGDNTIGFEDLANGGDRDYNDSVFQVNFSFV